MTAAQERYSDSVDSFARASEAHADSPGAETLAAKQRAGDRMAHLWSVADRECYASLGPVSMTMERGGIRLIRSSPHGGGSSDFVSKTNPRYPLLLAQIEADNQQDAGVAAVAYAAWNWTGPVSIDYYGDLAIVRDGGRRIVVHVPTLTVRA